MKPLLILFAATSLLGAATLAQADSANIDKVNGSIEVAAGQHAGKLSTVNGSIRLEDGAVVQSMSTVNGAVHAGARVTSGDVETVNGSIELGNNDHISGKVAAVNGALTIGRDARIDGHVSNVNGHIHITAATLHAGLETAAGDIDLEQGTHVDGGLLVDKQHTSWFNWGHSRPPRIVIGPHVVVNGTLDFRREVKLYVSNSATVGTIKGANAIRFSGAHPGQ